MKTPNPSFEKVLLLLYVLFFSYAHSLNAQTTITIGPGANWTDALIQSTVSTNQAHAPHFAAYAWTESGSSAYKRTLFKVNLNSIPVGATIQSAKLYLYSDPTVTGTVAWNGNSQHSGSNAVYFEKVTSNWSETAVIWNNQPPTTTTGRIWFPGSTSTIENIQVDIKSFVQGWVNSPSTNYGMKMRLENEAYYRSRTYGSENHTNASIRPKLVVVYTLEPDPVKDQMDHIFGELDQSHINTGILTDYGMGLVDQSLFDGVIRDENIMDMNSWRALYGSLLSSVINPSSDLIHLKTINQNLENYWATYDRGNPIVDVPLLFASYQSLRSDAISQGLISESNGRLHDVPGRPASPYTTGYAFAAAPHLGYDEDGEVTFIFRSNLFVNSSSRTFNNLQVNFGDGAGYQTVNLNTQKNINYTTAGTKILKFRIQFTDGSVYYSHSKFNILSVSSANLTLLYTGNDAHAYSFPRASDPNCPEPAFPNPEGSYGATVTVEYGNLGTRPNPGCTPQFIRPLIVVEGYDVSKFSALGVTNWDYNDFIGSRTNGGLRIDFNGPAPGTQTFSDVLDVAGYDLIFVDLNEGTGDIIQNAFLIENVIRWVNAHKINNPAGNREENVVLGQSMGGMITRYAICDMEKRRLNNPGNNPDHEVRLLVTHDSPHRGANVPLGFQAMVNELAPMKLTKIGMATYGLTGAIVGSFLELKDIVPALKQGDLLLDEPASRQMLVVQDGRSNTFLNGAYRSMITFPSGYSPSFEMRAISNGSECGIGQDLLQPGGEIFFADANLYVNRLLFTTGIAAAHIALGPALGTIVLGPLYALIPLTGKNWKTTHIVRATPSTGTNQVYYGKIGFEKKILFLIPINITLFEASRNSISGGLSWDSAPGGYYNLNIVQGSVPNNPNINAYPIIDVNLEVRLANAFGYVPTVSALDITTVNNQTIFDPYTAGINPGNPSRFANFITQENDPGEIIGSVNNSRHIQFTPTNAQWLFNEMQSVPNNNLNCSVDCQPAGIAVIGSTTICGQETYNINHLPPGYNISWASSGVTPVGSQNSINFTVNNTGGTGPLWVEARLTGLCGTLTYRKDLSLGRIDYEDITISGPDEVCPNEWYIYYAYNQSGIPISQYNWIFPYGWYIVEQDDSPYSGWVEVFTPNMVSDGDGVDLTIVNACGDTQPDWYKGIGEADFCSSSFSMYPNPAVESLTVELDQQKVNEEKEVKLLNRFHKVVREKKTKDSKLTFDTKNLPTGLYYLTVTSKGSTESMQVVIE